MDYSFENLSILRIDIFFPTRIASLLHQSLQVPTVVRKRKTKKQKQKQKQQNKTEMISSGILQNPRDYRELFISLFCFVSSCKMGLICNPTYKWTSFEPILFLVAGLERISLA